MKTFSDETIKELNDKVKHFQIIARNCEYGSKEYRKAVKDAASYHEAVEEMIKMNNEGERIAACILRES